MEGVEWYRMAKNHNNKIIYINLAVMQSCSHDVSLGCTLLLFKAEKSLENAL
jgi:hypothetical protein